VEAFAAEKYQKMNFFNQVYEVVRKIPIGKVTTYGDISLRLSRDSARDKRSGPVGSRINITPRIVGFALHANRDLNVPCHRVVNKDGRLAPNFAGPQLPGAIATGRRAFDGAVEQRRRLQKEGASFIDEMHVNLKKHQW